MNRPEPLLIESAPLPYLLSVPDAGGAGAWPVLCFLHGYDEGAPMPIRAALAQHGPLASSSSPLAAERFLLVAPQLPIRGDLWHRHAGDVKQIIDEVHTTYVADRRRTYLSGFSFGGNGVFDLALAQWDFWAALWPVDPTRVPPSDPGRPVWLSSGEISRHYARSFKDRLRLTLPETPEVEDRVYADQGHDHVGTATAAYRDARIYRWLLSKSLTD